MEYIGEPIILPDKDIMRMAFFCNKSFKEVEEKCSKIIQVDSTTRNRIARNYPKYHFTNESTALEFYAVGDKIYYPYNTYLSRNRLYLLAVSILVNNFADRIEADEIARQFSSFISNVKDIHYYQDALRQHIENMSSVYNKYSPYEPKNYDDLFVYAKKYKVKASYSPDKQYIVLEFPKVEVGNDIEGYIKYKKIILAFNKFDFKLKYAEYHFSDWYYNSAWGMEWVLHPHVHDRVCWGNRGSDFATYVTHQNWGFLIDLIKESVHSYHPDQPFSSIKNIAKRLNIMRKAIPSHIPQQNLTDEQKAEALLRWANDRLNHCRYCGDVTINHICTTPYCMGNPESIHTCPDCSRQMVWDTERRGFTCNHGQEVLPLDSRATVINTIDEVANQFNELLPDEPDPHYSPAVSDGSDIPEVTDRPQSNDSSTQLFCRACERLLTRDLHPSPDGDYTAGYYCGAGCFNHHSQYDVNGNEIILPQETNEEE